MSEQEKIAKLNKLISLLEGKLIDSFIRSSNKVRDKLDIDRIEILVKYGLGNIVSFQDLSALYQDFHKTLTELIPFCRKQIEEIYNNKLEKAESDQTFLVNQNNLFASFSFEPIDHTVLGILNLQIINRILDISNETLETIQSIIREGVSRGINPRVTARRIWDSIGLTTGQEQAVWNYRMALQELDRNALRRALRDGRSDQVVRRAIEEKRNLSEGQIERLVEKYRKRYLKYRAETISRTESMRTLNQTQYTMFKNFVERGDFHYSQIRRFWISTNDARTREDHIEIPKMNEDGVALDEPFNTPLGPIMFPGDPQADPRNVVNCRCIVFNRILSPELVGL